MPASNSEDEEEDLRYKKRRLASSSSSSSSKTHSHPHHLAQQVTPPSPANPNGGSEVMDQVRTTLKLKQQQKAIIESRQQATPTSTSPPTSQPKSSSSSPSSQPVTEKNPSGISVFHGSASFAAMNRRPLPLTSPKNPKNAKSLTIFAPSYSESSLSIQSAPLQPSHGHGRPLGHSHLPHALNHHPMSSMNPRTSQPLGHHKPHPFSQSQATPRSPTKLSGHAKKASRGLLRQPNHDHRYIFWSYECLSSLSLSTGTDFFCCCSFVVIIAIRELCQHLFCHHIQDHCHRPCIHPLTMHTHQHRSCRTTIRPQDLPPQRAPSMSLWKPSRDCMTLSTRPNRSNTLWRNRSGNRHSCCRPFRRAAP